MGDIFGYIRIFGNDVIFGINDNDMSYISENGNVIEKVFIIYKLLDFYMYDVLLKYEFSKVVV